MAESNAHRLLIVAGAVVAGVSELPSEVRVLIENASEILVMTPALPSALHLWTDDIDGARREADARLNAVLGDLDSITSDSQRTRGVIGDQVPITAFEDAVRAFSPDHILIGLRAADQASWQERDLLEEVRRRFDLPVTVFEVDAGGQVTTNH
jgi:hypothetical protein